MVRKIYTKNLMIGWVASQLADHDERSSQPEAGKGQGEETRRTETGTVNTRKSSYNL